MVGSDSDPAAGRARSRLSTDDRKHLRHIVRQIHPDLFSAHPAERAHNSTALQVGTDSICQAVTAAYEHGTLTISVQRVEDLAVLSDEA